MLKLLPLFLLLPFAPLGDAEIIWAAADAYVADGDLAKAKSALARFTPARVAEILRAGRPGAIGKAGETTLKLKDAYGTESDCIIWAPAKVTKPAGVILLLHGMGGDARKALQGRWYEAFATANNCILAAPSGVKMAGEGRAEDDPAGGDPLSWCIRPGSIVFALLREVRRTYPVDDDRIYVSGYSMGGFGTQRIGFRYPDRFAAIVAFAGGLSYTEYAGTGGDPKIRPLVENGKGLPVYLCHGDADSVVPCRFDRQTRDDMKAFGAECVYVEVPGAGHGLDVGGSLMKGIAPWMKEKKRTAHPKKITFISAGDYASSAWWVKVDGAAGARIVAEVKAKNVIEVSAKDVEKLTIYVDETLHDLAKPLTITSGGKELFKGKVDESTDVVLDSFRAREDKGLVYRAKIVVTPK